MNAADLDFLIRHYGSLTEVEAAFTRIVRCTACEKILGGELVYRRAYQLSGGASCLAVLCSGCAESIPVGSDDEHSFRQRLELAAAAAHRLRRLQ